MSNRSLVEAPLRPVVVPWSGLLDVGGIKRCLLMHRRIYVRDPQLLLSLLPRMSLRVCPRPSYAQIRGDIGYLLDLGVIAPIPGSESISSILDRGAPGLDTLRARGLAPSEWALVEGWLRLRTGGFLSLSSAVHEDLRATEHLARIARGVVEDELPVLRPTSALLPSPIGRRHTIDDPGSDVFSVVLDEFPTPSQQEGLSDVLDFVGDDVVRGRIADLHRWTRELSRNGFTSAQARAEARDLLEAYEALYRQGHLRHRRSRWEVVFRGAAGTLKCLSTGSPSALLELAADLVPAPPDRAVMGCREVAHIYHSRIRFGTRRMGKAAL